MWLAANVLHVLFDMHPLPGVRLQLTCCRAQPGTRVPTEGHLWDVVTLWVELDGIPDLPFVRPM